MARRHNRFCGNQKDGVKDGVTGGVDDSLQALTALLARLPGLGPRSARRILLHLMQHRETLMRPLADSLARVADSLVECGRCGNLDIENPCRICRDPRRDSSLLCVVADVADLWALERGHLFPGRYHVLGGLLSALDGVGPEQLRVGALLARLGDDPGIGEVVLAMNATLEGQTTAHFVAEALEGAHVRVTQLAHGVPVGGELGYLDEGTLAQALKPRRPL